MSFRERYCKDQFFFNKSCEKLPHFNKNSIYDNRNNNRRNKINIKKKSISKKTKGRK